ncbi:hypothetical protein BVRB_2g039860 isoform A [Beta vulgaris subsp. vulgaris]|nr:hypothetical protein BVRB_2g039860 isoform A [Beta vulgaris subsp. vulgaris]
MKIYGMRNLTALVLTSNNLSGFLHPENGNLENLSYLEINENKLSGDIPEELGKLKKLYFLDLSENHIGGSISPMLSGCSSLEYFNARMNVITCPIPNELPRSLQLLDISSNKVEDYEPYLADFGLAVATSDLEMDQRPNLCGSYGYMSLEIGLMPRITEKRDVYSFGVLAIESLTGKHPLNNFPEGSSLVQWVEDQIRRNVDPTQILDENLIELFDDPRILLEMQEINLKCLIVLCFHTS